MQRDEHDKLIADISRDEAWLAATMREYPEPTCPSLAALKHRVQVEVHAAALRESKAFDAQPSPDQALRAAKSAVRAELLADRSPIRGSRPVANWWWRQRAALGVLAAAAAIALWFVPLGGITPQSTPDAAPPDAPRELAGEFEDFQIALTSSATEDFDSAVASISADIDELYEAFTLADDGNVGVWDVDTEMDDIDSDLDDLFGELDEPSDV